MCVMSKRDKEAKRQRKWVKRCEDQSDKRTAAFVARQLDELQESLFDLIGDLRTFEHYSEIEDVGWCLRLMQRLKRKYQRFADNGVWSETD